MDTLRIDIRYRPLRVGREVRRGDFDSLRRICRWSHTLYGPEPQIDVAPKQEDDFLLSESRQQKS